MTSSSKAVAVQETGPPAIIKMHEARIAPVLPEHINVTQFVGLAIGALYRDPKLMEAANNNPGALMNALMQCGALGHQPGTKEFYFTVRRNKKNGNRPEIQGIEGYQGIVERMYRSGAVASVIVREVCENDKFAFVEGVHDRPQHEVNWFGGNRGEMIGVYAYAILTTGAVSRVAVLNRDDVMAAKAKSENAASEYSAWNSKEDGGRAMWWKTAARRLEPWVPTSAEYRREQIRAAVEATKAAETAAPTVAAEPTPHTPRRVDEETGEVIEAEFVDPEENPGFDND